MSEILLSTKIDRPHDATFTQRRHPGDTCQAADAVYDHPSPVSRCATVAADESAIDSQQALSVYAQCGEPPPPDASLCGAMRYPLVTGDGGCAAATNFAAMKTTSQVSTATMSRADGDDQRLLLLPRLTLTRRRGGYDFGCKIAITDCTLSEDSMSGSNVSRLLVDVPLASVTSEAVVAVPTSPAGYFVDYVIKCVNRRILPMPLLDLIDAKLAAAAEEDKPLAATSATTRRLIDGTRSLITHADRSCLVEVVFAPLSPIGRFATRVFVTLHTSSYGLIADCKRLAFDGGDAVKIEQGNAKRKLLSELDFESDIVSRTKLQLVTPLAAASTPFSSTYVKCHNCRSKGTDLLLEEVMQLRRRIADMAACHNIDFISRLVSHPVAYYVAAARSNAALGAVGSFESPVKTVAAATAPTLTHGGVIPSFRLHSYLLGKRKLMAQSRSDVNSGGPSVSKRRRSFQQLNQLAGNRVMTTQTFDYVELMASRNSTPLSNGVVAGTSTGPMRFARTMVRRNAATAAPPSLPANYEYTAASLLEDDHDDHRIGGQRILANAVTNVDMTPHIVEEYILEAAERSSGSSPSSLAQSPQPPQRVYHTRLTIFQRAANDEYLGQLYVERDFRPNEGKGATCRFSLGDRTHALRYINQFTEIFTEEGRKSVRITHIVPNQPPRISFTPGMRERIAAIQQQVAAAAAAAAAAASVNSNVANPTPPDPLSPVPHMAPSYRADGSVVMAQQPAELSQSVPVALAPVQPTGAAAAASVSSPVIIQARSAVPGGPQQQSPHIMYVAQRQPVHSQYHQQQHLQHSSTVASSSTTMLAHSASTSPAVASNLGGQPLLQTDAAVATPSATAVSLSPRTPSFVKPPSVVNVVATDGTAGAMGGAAPPSPVPTQQSVASAAAAAASSSTPPSARRRRAKGTSAVETASSSSGQPASGATISILQQYLQQPSPMRSSGPPTAADKVIRRSPSSATSSSATAVSPGQLATSRYVYVNGQPQHQQQTHATPSGPPSRSSTPTSHLGGMTVGQQQVTASGQSVIDSSAIRQSLLALHPIPQQQQQHQLMSATSGGHAGGVVSDATGPSPASLLYHPGQSHVASGSNLQPMTPPAAVNVRSPVKPVTPVYLAEHQQLNRASRVTAGSRAEPSPVSSVHVAQQQQMMLHASVAGAAADLQQVGSSAVYTMDCSPHSQQRHSAPSPAMRPASVASHSMDGSCAASPAAPSPSQGHALHGSHPHHLAHHPVAALAQDPVAPPNVVLPTTPDPSVVSASGGRQSQLVVHHQQQSQFGAVNGEGQTFASGSQTGAGPVADTFNQSTLYAANQQQQRDASSVPDGVGVVSNNNGASDANNESEAISAIMESLLKDSEQFQQQSCASGGGGGSSGDSPNTTLGLQQQRQPPCALAEQFVDGGAAVVSATVVSSGGGTTVQNTNMPLGTMLPTAPIPQSSLAPGAAAVGPVDPGASAHRFTQQHPPSGSSAGSNESVVLMQPQSVQRSPTKIVTVSPVQPGISEFNNVSGDNVIGGHAVLAPDSTSPPSTLKGDEVSRLLMHAAVVTGGTRSTGASSYGPPLSSSVTTSPPTVTTVSPQSSTAPTGRGKATSAGGGTPRRAPRSRATPKQKSIDSADSPSRLTNGCEPLPMPEHSSGQRAPSAGVGGGRKRKGAPTKVSPASGDAASPGAKLAHKSTPPVRSQSRSVVIPSGSSTITLHPPPPAGDLGVSDISTPSDVSLNEPSSAAGGGRNVTTAAVTGSSVGGGAGSTPTVMPTSNVMFLVKSSSTAAPHSLSQSPGGPASVSDYMSSTVAASDVHPHHQNQQMAPMTINVGETSGGPKFSIVPLATSGGGTGGVGGGSSGNETGQMAYANVPAVQQQQQPGEATTTMTNGGATAAQAPPQPSASQRSKGGGRSGARGGGGGGQQSGAAAKREARKNNKVQNASTSAYNSGSGNKPAMAVSDVVGHQSTPTATMVSPAVYSLNNGAPMNAGTTVATTSATPTVRGVPRHIVIRPDGTLAALGPVQAGATGVATSATGPQQPTSTVRVFHLAPPQQQQQQQQPHQSEEASSTSLVGSANASGPVAAPQIGQSTFNGCPTVQPDQISVLASSQPLPSSGLRPASATSQQQQQRSMATADFAAAQPVASFSIPASMCVMSSATPSASNSIVLASGRGSSVDRGAVKVSGDGIGQQMVAVDAATATAGQTTFLSHQQSQPPPPPQPQLQQPTAAVTAAMLSPQHQQPTQFVGQLQSGQLVSIVSPAGSPMKGAVSGCQPVRLTAAGQPQSSPGAASVSPRVAQTSPLLDATRRQYIRAGQVVSQQQPAIPPQPVFLQHQQQLQSQQTLCEGEGAAGVGGNKGMQRILIQIPQAATGSATTGASEYMGSGVSSGGFTPNLDSVSGAGGGAGQQRVYLAQHPSSTATAGEQQRQRGGQLVRSVSTSAATVASGQQQQLVTLVSPPSAAAGPFVAAAQQQHLNFVTSASGGDGSDASATAAPTASGATMLGINSRL